MHVFKLYSNVSVVLRGNNIDFVHETKTFRLILNSRMKTSSDVIRQMRKFYTHFYDIAQFPLLHQLREMYVR